MLRKAGKAQLQNYLIRQPSKALKSCRCLALHSLALGHLPLCSVGTGVLLPNWPTARATFFSKAHPQSVAACAHPTSTGQTHPPDANSSVFGGQQTTRLFLPKVFSTPNLQKWEERARQDGHSGVEAGRHPARAVGQHHEPARKLLLQILPVPCHELAPTELCSCRCKLHLACGSRLAYLYYQQPSAANVNVEDTKFVCD